MHSWYFIFYMDSCYIFISNYNENFILFLNASFIFFLKFNYDILIVDLPSLLASQIISPTSSSVSLFRCIGRTMAKLGGGDEVIFWSLSKTWNASLSSSSNSFI